MAMSLRAVRVWSLRVSHQLKIYNTNGKANAKQLGLKKIQNIYICKYKTWASLLSLPEK